MASSYDIPPSQTSFTCISEDGSEPSQYTLIIRDGGQILNRSISSISQT